MQSNSIISLLISIYSSLSHAHIVCMCVLRICESIFDGEYCFSSCLSPVISLCCSMIFSDFLFSVHLLSANFILLKIKKMEFAIDEWTPIIMYVCMEKTCLSSCYFLSVLQVFYLLFFVLSFVRTNEKDWSQQNNLHLEHIWDTHNKNNTHALALAHTHHAKVCIKYNV